MGDYQIVKDKQLGLDINILVTSISKKVSILKTLKEVNFRLGNSGKLWGGDVDGTCIGRYFVDGFWEMPFLDSLDINDFIRFCHKENVSCVLPTRDGELSYFSKYRDVLSEKKIQVMVSNYDAIQTCLDKLIFSTRCKSLGFPAIPTVAAENIDDLGCSRYVVKERFGAGSRKIALKLSREKALAHAQTLENPIFQPYISGQEYSVDLYVELTGKVKGGVVRVRDLVVNGESQVSFTVRNQRLEMMCARLAESLGLFGHIVFQVFIDENDDFHIVECNARFGGASRLAFKAGLDSFYWFLLESLGKDISIYPFMRSDQEKKLVRYPEDLII